MIYLDNSASTKAFTQAAETVKKYMLEDYFNPSASYAAALPEEKEFLKCRETVSRLTGGRTVYFTSGGTEGANTAVIGAVEGSSKSGETEVIISEIEHPAVMQAAFSLRRRGVKVLLAPVEPAGNIDPERVKDMVTAKTALVSIMHVNNETGAINDIDAIAAAVKEKNPDCLVHSDGVQGHMRLETPQGADIYTTSAHKLHGPKGMGAIAVGKNAKLAPLIYGGGQQDNFRPGTLNMPGIAGYASALEIFEESRALERISKIKQEYLKLLSEIEGVCIIGTHTAPHIICAAFEGVQAASLQSALEARGVIVGKGSACSSRKNRVSEVLLAMKVPAKYAGGAIRISIGALNTMEECSQTAGALKESLNYLRRFKRK